MKRARSSFSTKGSKWEATTRPGANDPAPARLCRLPRVAARRNSQLGEAEAQSRSPRASPNADLIVKASGVRVEIELRRATPSTDHVQMPPDEAFASPPDGAATRPHELCIVATVIVGGVVFVRGRLDHGLALRP